MKKTEYIKPTTVLNEIELQPMMNASLDVDKETELEEDDDFLGKRNGFSLWDDEEEE